MDIKCTVVHEEIQEHRQNRLCCHDIKLDDIILKVQCECKMVQSIDHGMLFSSIKFLD